MLPKNYRLKNDKAFSATYRLKNTASNKYFLAYLGLPVQEEEQNLKIGFVVSKKFHKRAVKRNRIKRLMREVIRQKIKQDKLLDAKKLRSLIFIAKPPSLELDYNSTENAITQLLERIKLC